MGLKPNQNKIRGKKGGRGEKKDREVSRGLGDLRVKELKMHQTN